MNAPPARAPSARRATSTGLSTVERLKARLDKPLPAVAIDDIVGELARRIAPAAERLQWLQASLGNTIKLINVDDVLHFQSDTKYTRDGADGPDAHDGAAVHLPEVAWVELQDIRASIQVFLDNRLQPTIIRKKPGDLPA